MKGSKTLGNTVRKYMHSLLIDANKWGTHKIIQINNVLAVRSDVFLFVCFFPLFNIRNICHGWNLHAGGLILVSLDLIRKNSVLEIKKDHKLKLPLQPMQNIREENKTKQAKPLLCREKENKETSFDSPHLKITQEFQWLLHDNKLYHKYFSTAAHIHGFLRPAWAHFFF